VGGRENQERAQLILEVVREDRTRADARFAQDRDRQRIGEAEKSARLRELRLATEAAEARAKRKVRLSLSQDKKRPSG